VLANREVSGDKLGAEVVSQGIKNISIIPLDMEALHDRLRLVESDLGSSDDERRKELWNWLQEVSGNPKELGRMLASDQFWATMSSDDPLARSDLVEVLSGLGVMLDRALQTVPEEVRARIGEQLSRLGQELSLTDLARLVDVYLVGQSPTEAALKSLMRHVQGERLAGVLGGLVSLGGAKEERVASFVRRFIPADAILGLAGLVRDWQGTGEKMGFAPEIWKWLESFLLDMDEDDYLGEGYRETLDRMAMRLRTVGESGTAFGFFEDPQTHLDRLTAGLAMEGVADGPKLLADRITQRLDELDGLGTLELLELTEQTFPKALDGRADVFEKLFREAAGGVKDFSSEVRKRFIEFPRRHEADTLEVLLKALGEEERISVRRFYVEILCNFSNAVVPSVVRVAKRSPWYVVRNLSIVLGRLGDARALPYLRSLLDHENPKVRKETIRSLGFMDTRARTDLVNYSLRSDRPMDERRMAQIAAERMKAS
jgi:hypothetical protein